MSPVFIGIIGVLVFFLLISAKLPIALAMGLVGLLGISYLISPSSALSLVAAEIYSVFSSYSLSVIPMFVWMGFLAFHAGIGTKLYNFTYTIIGHKRAGLAIATQAACAVFGAICGSNTATAATMGAIALPEMKKYNYNDSLSTASVAAGGALGVLIPPSVIFIVYGINTQQSIGKLFIAGIIPGILLMLLYMLTIYIIALKNPAVGPPGPKSGLKEKVNALRGGLLEVLIVFCISIGGLFAGWFTPTEAGAVGSASILVISLLEKRLNWKQFQKSLIDTTRTTAMIMFMVAGAMIFSRFIVLSRIPNELASWAAGLTIQPFMVMGLILLIYLILGCFIDALALILLTIPIFFPVATTVLGYDPIWFGVIIVMVVAMGVITPPVGMNVYIIKGVAPEIPLETIFKGVWPFLIALMVCIAILIAFPQIVTFLPRFLS